MGTTRMNRPDINIPRTGTLLGIYFAPNDKDANRPDLSVHGTWEPNPMDANGAGFPGGEGRFYIGYHHIDRFTEAGLVKYSGAGQGGHPTFTVIDKRQRMCLYIRKDGTRNVLKVFGCDQAGNPIQLAAQPATPPLGGGAAPAPAAAAAGGAPAAPPAPGSAPTSAPTPAAPSADANAPAKPKRSGPPHKVTLAQWAALGDEGMVAMRMARRTVLDFLGIPLDTFMDSEALPMDVKLRILELTTSHASTLMIAANRDKRLASFPGMAALAYKIPANAHPIMVAAREILTGMPATNGHGAGPHAPAEPPPPAPATSAAGKPTAGGWEEPEHPIDDDDDDLPF